MTTQDVCNLLNKLFKDEIKRQGLVSSGRLLNSIKWSYDNSGFHMIAEDYFKFVDAKYKITENVLESPKFANVMEIYYAGIIENELTSNK
jgi:hypothetical protein